MMMDRGQQQQHHQTHDSQQQPQTYDPQQQPPRAHLSRSVSYPVPAQTQYSTQIHENLSSSSLPVSHHKNDSTATQYAGLGISMQGGTDNTSQSQLLPSPDSPFSAQLLSRYGGTGQPPTPSFPNLRSSSPASSVWSASDQGTSSSALSGFIPRLHKMVSDEKYQHLISWNHSGTSFYISQVNEFARTVLPLHFKHSNFSSFVRQLNMYGFHKVNKTPRGYKVAQDSQVWEFSHTKFIRHRPDLLDEIKRRQGDVDFIREGDMATHMNLMQVQQSDLVKQVSALQEQVGALVNGLNESRKRQQTQEERLKQVMDYLEKLAQKPPVTNVKQTLQRKQSMQKPPNRRPSNVARLVLDESIDRRYSISTTTTQDLETFFEGGDASSTGALGTPPQSSPPASQPSSSGSGHRSPGGPAKSLRASAVFSTPSSINTSTTQYTPASSYSSISSMQRGQGQSSATSPSLRRNKSMVMPSLPSPNVTPTPSYNYPAQYAPTLATIESQSPTTTQQVSSVLQQELHSLRPQSSHPSLQAAQPPATYQSAAAPYATPPRISHHQQYSTATTTPQFPLRQDQYIHTESMQLASPASFTPSSMHTFTQQHQHQHQQMQQQQQQQQQEQQRRRRQNSDVTDDMDLGS